jgi:hypothetical protein
VRTVIRRAVACALAYVVLSSPTTAGGISLRTVTITLHGGGKALWKLDSSGETGRLVLDYRWHGAVRFAVPMRLLTDPKHRGLSVSSAATLVASWSGNYRRKEAGAVTTCRYSGASVRSRITAKLGKGRAANTLELTWHPGTAGSGFFSDKGRGAVVRCSSGYTQSAPAHFAPSWFFRDNLQDHGRFSSDTAIIVLPNTLLPRGSATVAFPNERGRNDSEAVGHIAWSNRGQTVIRSG